MCPQDPLKSQWVVVAFGAAVAALGRAPDLGAPGAPGPFAFADGDRLTQLLADGGRACGWRPSPSRFASAAPSERLSTSSVLTGEQAAVRGRPQDTIDAAATALYAGFAPYAGEQGVMMDATAWLVTAHR